LPINIFTFFNEEILICFGTNELWSYNLKGNWNRIFYGKDKNLSILDLKFCSNNIYLVLSDSTIAYTSNFGSSWDYLKVFAKAYQILLTNKFIFLTTHEDPGDVNAGVFRAKILNCVIDPTSIEAIKFSQKPESIISPNPAVDFIEISNPPLETGSGGVRIYNVLGEIQSTPVCSADTPASGGHRINVSSLTPGIYFVRIGDKVSKFLKY
jgi:hypothetical protein